MKPHLEERNRKIRQKYDRFRAAGLGDCDAIEEATRWWNKLNPLNILQSSYVERRIIDAKVETCQEN